MNCPVCDKKITKSNPPGVMFHCRDEWHEYNHTYTDAMVIRIDTYVIVRRSDLHGNWGYISGKGIETYFDEYKSDEKIFKYIEQIKLLM